MSALLVRTNGILALTPNEDHSEKTGYGVTFSGTTASLSASASVPIAGVILEGGPTTGKSTVALLGCAGTVRVKISATVTAGQRIKQYSDGTFRADGAGERQVVGIALESGVSGDLIEAQLWAPLYYAS